MNKKIFTLIFISLSIISYNQSQNFSFESKFIEYAIFDQSIDDYASTGKEWQVIRVDIWDDYVQLTGNDEDGNQEKRILWWEMNEEESSDNYVVYYTEKNIEKIVFNTLEDEIYIFYEYNEKLNLFIELMILSKITQIE